MLNEYINNGYSFLEYFLKDLFIIIDNMFKLRQYF